MVALNFETLHAQNPKLTHNLFTAGTAPHTTKLKARRDTWIQRGNAVLELAKFWYGAEVRQTLWQALRPRVVDSRLAAKKDDWLAQVVGMCDEFEVSADFAEGFQQQWPTQAGELTDAQRQIALQHGWPKKVAVWVFDGQVKPHAAFDLLQARGFQQNLTTISEALGLQTEDEGTILRALMLCVSPFVPTPTPLRQSVVAQVPQVKKPVAESSSTPKNPQTPTLPPVFIKQVLTDLHQVQQHGGTKQMILPLALNLASLVNRLRQVDRLQAVELIATTVTSGGLHELAPLLDQALLIDQAQVTILTQSKPMNAATQADLNELSLAGAQLLTPKRRSLGANVIKLVFDQVTVMIMGSSDITASDYHTSLQLDSLWLTKGDLLANWWGDLWPHVTPFIPKVTTVTTRKAILSRPVDALANFKATIAQLKDRDTHARMTAWLAYQPKPPVAMTLDGQAYFALSFPQYDVVVVDTLVPNNALFFQGHGQLSVIAQAQSKQALIKLGAKRAYHTEVPIGVRVRRILQSGQPK
ncbi:hypothetical protein [Lacticaseibacillus porcinae]|uniref:hypothetical protein n=1 Tax=Lacticaseibacillus porcinae TaxID=1123687 RepID=UPI000F779D60|nr:hypothetical protein [Lacticaseibacillus porcinae]